MVGFPAVLATSTKQSKGIFPTLVVLLVWFADLCSHLEFIQKHRFPYRKQTQTRHLELQHRANLNEIAENGQESERLCLLVKLNQQKHDVKVRAVFPT